MTVQIKVFWDSQDPDNEGWAFSIEGDQGIVDSGEAVNMPENREDVDRSDFITEIMLLAYVYGLRAVPGDVVHETHDGGFARCEAVSK